MSNQNWYTTSDWYAPLEQTTEESQRKQTRKQKKDRGNRKGLTPVRIAGIVVITVLLIVGTSLAFSKTGKGDSVVIGEDFQTKMPTNPEEFFKNYYKSIESYEADIKLETVELPLDFELELKEAEDNELSLNELYKKCSPSIVAISGYKSGNTGYSWGTGIILSEDGLVLTNTHIVDGCDYATVTLCDDRSFEAKLVGGDATSDIAVLKIEAEGLTPAVFGESSNLEVGDAVAAIGNPLGEALRMTMTDGIVSAIERGVKYNGEYMNLIQTNTALNNGNSGGALFNMYGQVIGITNMKMTSNYSSIEGIGFAIPSDTVREVVSYLVKDGKVSGRALIGITVGAIPTSAANAYEMPEGLYISEVSEGSDAKEKGIKVGDVLVEVNGTQVRVTNDVLTLREGMLVGETMHFKLWRDGEYFEVDVALVDSNDLK